VETLGVRELDPPKVPSPWGEFLLSRYSLTVEKYFSVVTARDTESLKKKNTEVKESQQNKTGLAS